MKGIVFNGVELPVRLLVRAQSGVHYVDQGFMFREMAEEKKREWNALGFGCLVLKHALPTVRIVTRPYTYSTVIAARMIGGYL